MKVKIDDCGLLWIKRASAWKKQVCPFRSDKFSVTHCGDECPLFDKPIKSETKGHTELHLCHHLMTVKKTDFTDDRKS